MYTPHLYLPPSWQICFIAPHLPGVFMLEFSDKILSILSRTLLKLPSPHCLLALAYLKGCVTDPKRLGVGVK